MYRATQTNQLDTRPAATTASESRALDHVNSAWATAGKKQAVPSSGGSNPQPVECSAAGSSATPDSAGAVASPSSAAAAPAKGVSSGRGSTYSLNCSHSSPKATAFVKPAKIEQNARMQIGIRISFGDSRGG